MYDPLAFSGRRIRVRGVVIIIIIIISRIESGLGLGGINQSSKAKLVSGVGGRGKAGELRGLGIGIGGEEEEEEEEEEDAHRPAPCVRARTPPSLERKKRIKFESPSMAMRCNVWFASRRVARVLLGGWARLCFRLDFESTFKVAACEDYPSIAISRWRRKDKSMDMEPSTNSQRPRRETREEKDGDARLGCECTETRLGVQKEGDGLFACLPAWLSDSLDSNNWQDGIRDLDSGSENAGDKCQKVQNARRDSWSLMSRSRAKTTRRGDGPRDGEHLAVEDSDQDGDPVGGDKGSGRGVRGL
ncbi:hypothetical protein B0H11DRAFT_2333749 [Mycena galericulata]|nr:hypothetical protein B0H11DRAFT_2333749 [Mycena galericulata]